MQAAAAAFVKKMGAVMLAVLVVLCTTGKHHYQEMVCSGNVFRRIYSTSKEAKARAGVSSDNDIRQQQPYVSVYLIE